VGFLSFLLMAFQMRVKKFFGFKVSKVRNILTVRNCKCYLLGMYVFFGPLQTAYVHFGSIIFLVRYTQFTCSYWDLDISWAPMESNYPEILLSTRGGGKKG